jgi:hypothetical protein
MPPTWNSPWPIQAKVFCPHGQPIEKVGNTNSGCFYDSRDPLGHQDRYGLDQGAAVVEYIPSREKILPVGRSPHPELAKMRLA